MFYLAAFLLDTRLFNHYPFMKFLQKNSRGVIHRDIKLSNCLLDDYGHIKLCDFGCARVLFDINDCHGPFSPRKSYEACPKAKTFIGTFPFMAPEVRKLRYQKGRPTDSGLSSNSEHDGYSLPVDWYALGIIFFELLTGSHEACLFYDTIDGLLSYENGYDKLKYDDLKVTDFIFRLLNDDPKSRLGYWQREEILRHPIFLNRRATNYEIDWSSIEIGTSRAPVIDFDRSVGHFEMMQLLLSKRGSIENHDIEHDKIISAEEQSKFEGY